MPSKRVGRPEQSEAPPFGKRLSFYRRKKGYSQEQFSKILGISLENLAYYERRAKNPTLKVLLKVAKALNVSVEDLTSNDLPKESKSSKK